MAATTCASALAQPQKAPTPGDLLFRTGVSVVAVPVFVTDKQGRAIPGLTADDFDIEDQGKKVPVVGFVAVDAGAPETGQLKATPPALQAARARQFLLLFDLTFSNSAGILQARAAAQELLEHALFPSDLVAAATFSATGARVLVGFIPDRQQVATAIETLGAAEGQRLSNPLGLAYDLNIDVEKSIVGARVL